MDLISCLNAIKGTNYTEKCQAEAQIYAFRSENIDQLCQELIEIIGNESFPNDIKTVAAAVLRRSFSIPKMTESYEFLIQQIGSIIQ